MEGDFIPRHEHEEFRRTMDSENQRLQEENSRQNQRIKSLEETITQVATISTSVEKLALNMQNMLEELKAQGGRLTTLESRDGDKWRKTSSYIVTAVIGIIVGYICKQIGF